MMHIYDLDDTLSNAVLNGVTFDCYYYGELYAIDPTKINITGTDFTGSKGAIVTLENVTEMPENCNLTDAIIIVNSKDDIKRFNLEKYGENVYIKQSSIVSNHDLINYDIYDFLNYTGTIDDMDIKSIEDALRLDGASEEEIRIQKNKILSYLITLDLNEEIDYEVLSKYLEIIKKVDDSVKEHQSEIKEYKDSLSVDNADKKDLSKRDINVYSILNKLGSIFKKESKCIDNKFKIYTRNGVFTIDLLRLGLSEEKLELALKDELELDIRDYLPESLMEFFKKIYDYYVELENESDKPAHNNEETSPLNNILYDVFQYLFSDADKRGSLRTYFTEELEELITNNLEESNKGYSYTMK